MIDGLKRGKWVAGRTVGLVRRVAPELRGLNEGEWEALSESVETYANLAVDEAVVEARKQVFDVLDAFAAGADGRDSEKARMVREAIKTLHDVLGA